MRPPGPGAVALALACVAPAVASACRSEPPSSSTGASAAPAVRSSDVTPPSPARTARAPAPASTECAPGRDCGESASVPGGQFRRSYDGAECNDGSHPATVSAFHLDAFEVTVARFRRFAGEGGGTRAHPPADGAGAHPRIPGSGWDPGWTAHLELDAQSLERGLRCGPGGTATWTGATVDGDRERLPINCLTFYEAFAFCAWDGGRLPTEAEWNFAAAGGDEQRVFPWSSPPGSASIDRSQAVFGESRPQLAGSTSPAGNGRWGHADLAGNVWEWTLDAAPAAELLPTVGVSHCPAAGYRVPCADCATLGPGDARVLRGGGFGMPQRGLIASLRRTAAASSRQHVFGVRCARDVPRKTAGTSPSPTGAAVGPAGSALPSLPGNEVPAVLKAGAALPDFELRGVFEPKRDVMAMRSFRMSDWRNSTGNERFEPQSPFGDGFPKPRALVVHFGAAWSRDSRAAASRLEAIDVRDRGRGGRVLLVLVDGERKDQMTDAHGVIAWTRAEGISHPVAIDLESKVAGGVGALPVTAIVDLRTMGVVQMARGAVPEGEGEGEAVFWGVYERLLGGR